MITHYAKILTACLDWQGWHQLDRICNWPQARVRDLEKRGHKFERRRVTRMVNGREREIVQIRVKEIKLRKSSCIEK